MSEYVFDQAWERERERLRGLESLYDSATIRFLTALGVTEGWSCLEVGCGAGAVALWLAEQVGTSGRVVATDLDTRFIDGHGRASLDVRTHDILRGAPEQAAFDLVHARAVIEHIADHETALTHVLAAVRPGGWVLIEDVDFGGPMATALARYSYPPELATMTERLFRACEAVFAAIGADASYGTQLVGALEAAGYQEVGGELHAAVVAGGSEQWTRGTAEQLADHLVHTGLITAEDLAQFLALSAQHNTHYDHRPSPAPGADDRPPDATQRTPPGLGACRATRGDGRRRRRLEQKGSSRPAPGSNGQTGRRGQRSSGTARVLRQGARRLRPHTA